ncbi:MAG: hypothetical protein LBM12_00120 [Candidatus Nomurabacteria bacterium]|nr:hypothetical protein [Candidatus Nomurabacteria bacterium]
MALGEVRQSGISNSVKETLDQVLEHSKGDPRSREEAIKALQDRIRGRGQAAISAAPAVRAVAPQAIMSQVTTPQAVLVQPPADPREAA